MATYRQEGIQAQILCLEKAISIMRVTASGNDSALGAIADLNVQVQALDADLRNGDYSPTLGRVLDGSQLQNRIDAIAEAMAPIFGYNPLDQQDEIQINRGASPINSPEQDLEFSASISDKLKLFGEDVRTTITDYKQDFPIPSIPWYVIAVVGVLLAVAITARRA